MCGSRVLWSQANPTQFLPQELPEVGPEKQSRCVASGWGRHMKQRGDEGSRASDGRQSCPVALVHSDNPQAEAGCWEKDSLDVSLSDGSCA